jgi:hypothetical protein
MGSLAGWSLVLVSSVDGSGFETLKSGSGRTRALFQKENWQWENWIRGMRAAQATERININNKMGKREEV